MMREGVAICCFNCAVCSFMNPLSLFIACIAVDIVVLLYRPGETASPQCCPVCQNPSSLTICSQLPKRNCEQTAQSWPARAGRPRETAGGITIVHTPVQIDSNYSHRY